jgi:nicotinamidase-related amidase
MNAPLGQLEAVLGDSPHWAAVDIADLLSLPSAYLAIGYSNSLLSENGAQSHERLWSRTRQPGGALPNTLELVAAARKAKISMFWTRYEIFRQQLPQSPLDKSQYDHWAHAHEGWTAAQIDQDWQPTQEIRDVMRPEDQVIHYTSLGNVFVGTMLPSYLNMLGVRTVLLSGFHLDWCIEQAARTCRDLGYIPIVVGDACACGDATDDIPTLKRINRYFAPVISTAQAIAAMRS